MNPWRILVVEDEALVARDLRATLLRMGYDVPATVRTGDAALETAREMRPDLALMDIRLGEGMDGIETARNLQEGLDIPVVFLTAYADETTMARARSTQPYGYLLKPFHEGELRSVVELAVARHQANARLKASEAHFVNTLRSMTEGVISADLLGKVTFMNPSAEALTGWTQAEAMGCPLQDIFRITNTVGLAVEPLGWSQGGSEGASRSIYLTTKSGLPLLIDDSTAPIRDADGCLSGIVVLFRKKEAPAQPDEQAPDESAEAAPWPNLAGIVQSIADPLMALSADWRISYLNSQAAAVLNERRDSLLGKSLWDCLAPSIYRLYYHEFSQALALRQARSFELENEAGGQFFEVQLYPFGDGLLVLMRDVSVRKQAEEQERKLEKLESLGLLARGFAHDFNNLLTVLLGNLALAEIRLPEDEPCQEEISQAKSAALQAQGLVQHLLTFSRGGAPIKQPTDLGRLTQSWFLEWKKKNHIDYRCEISEYLWQAEIDRQQFTRMLHNLMRNAEQAIARAGVISLRLTGAGDPSIPEDERAVPPGADPSQWIVLQIEDDGEGIPRDRQMLVFEPYFTTRGEANASGLGLTVCESIAKAHGGSLTLKSVVDHGTIVSLCIPAFIPPVKPPVQEPAEEVAPRKRGRRILILEDEPLIRQLMVANLKAAKCDVVQTAEGSETIAKYQEALEQGNAFDLLVMDLSIPNGMGGAAALEQILKLDPAARAIVSSGYSDDPVMSRYLDYGFSAVLPKPYQPHELRDLVEEMLRA